MTQIRILHVLGALDRGGVETWLMHVLRHIDAERYQMDFLVHSAQPAEYDAEARSRGAEIIACPYTRKPWLYALRLAEILKHRRPYDVVHCHSHCFSGLVLWTAAKRGVPVRIAHSHNDERAADRQLSLARQTYHRILSVLTQRHSTLGFAASTEAALSLFGERWPSDHRWRILRCGIDPEPFHRSVDCATTRRKYGLPEDAAIVGHIGRFNTAKNHALWVRIAAEISRVNPGTHFVLVGVGPLMKDVVGDVEQLGLSRQFTFLGVQKDVPEILAGCMDVFLFPSLHEGLPLALLEAQSAGVPSVVSDVISPETDFAPDLVSRVSLESHPTVWAKKVQEKLIVCGPKVSRAEQLEASPFSIRSSIDDLCRAYRSAVNGSGRANE